MTDYEIIIIGSGIGGSAVGALLASKGLKVLLLEKNDLIGGRCSTYEKEGFKIDVGVHSFGRSGKGPLGTILEKIGMENAIEWKIAKKPGPRWYYQGKFFRFPLEFAQFLAPSDYKILMKMLKDIMSKDLETTKDLENIDLQSWVSNYTNNTLIHSFFNTICWMYFVVPYNEASAGEFLRCLASLSKDLLTGYPKGGCISIPSAYIKGIEKFGGTVKTNHLVKKIVIENNRVSGVELENGAFVPGKIVISNGGIKHTINNLVGKKYFDKNFINTIDKLKYSMSAITLKIALKKPITDLKVLMTVSRGDPRNYFDEILNGKVPDELDFFVPIPSNYDSDMTPKGMQLMTAGTAVCRDNFEKNRKKWIDTCISNLNEIFPGLSNNLLWVDITAPNDIENFGGKEASVVGISQIVGQTGKNRPKSTLPLEGLYVVGGDAGGWGIGTEMAANSAFDCANMILDKLKLHSS